MPIRRGLQIENIIGYIDKANFSYLPLLRMARLLAQTRGRVLKTVLLVCDLET